MEWIRFAQSIMEGKELPVDGLLFQLGQFFERLQREDKEPVFNWRDFNLNRQHRRCLWDIDQQALWTKISEEWNNRTEWKNVVYVDC